MRGLRTEAESQAPHRHGDDGLVHAIDDGELGRLAARVEGLLRH